MKKHFITLLLPLCFHYASAQDFKVTGSISVPGNEGWDYLSINEAAQHLFVSHGTVVNVIDLKTNKVIATIPDTNGVHGIAIANGLNKAFITDGKENAISIVDLTTFKLLEKVSTKGIKPDAILYDAFSRKVFAFNGKSNDATILDAATHRIIGTIPLSGKPEFSVTNHKGLIYVNIEDKSEIKAIDAQTLQVVNTWSIAPGEEPTGLAIDNETKRLFSVCGNKTMVVMDAENGKVVTTLPIGDGCDGVAFDPKKKLVFSSNGEGNVTVVKELGKDKFAVVQTLATKKGGRTITLDQATGALYIPTADYTPVAATAASPNPRPGITPDSFKILIVK